MNLRLFGQCVLQLFGLLYATVRYGGEDTATTYLSKVEYSLPFKGEWYVANGGATKAASHSWDILPQRFAYDFFIADGEGRRFRGDQKELKSYFCYGADVLAPADGVVVAVKNHYPDCRIMDDGQPDPATPDIGGNRVIIKHAKREYSAICHLAPESVVVRKGQKVKRGDIIAKCGNSGNTTEPHIHFQVQNAAGFYSCRGLPVCFRNIETEPHANYSQIDTRPFPTSEDQVAGYLHRGLSVKNR